MCAREDDPSQHEVDWQKTFEGTPYPDPVHWTPEIVQAGIQEAKEHGHPSWSHAFAYGPCNKPSKFGVLELREIDRQEDLRDKRVRELFTEEELEAKDLHDRVFSLLEDYAESGIQHMNDKEAADLTDSFVHDIFAVFSCEDTHVHQS